MTRRAQDALLLAAAIAAGLFGAMNTFITVAASDPRAMQPYHVKAFVTLGICEAVVVIVLFRGTVIGRVAALLVGLIALNPLWVLLQQAPYVWP